MKMDLEITIFSVSLFLCHLPCHLPCSIHSFIVFSIHLSISHNKIFFLNTQCWSIHFILDVNSVFSSGHSGPLSVFFSFATIPVTFLETSKETQVQVLSRRILLSVLPTRQKLTKIFMKLYHSRVQILMVHHDVIKAAIGT